jgi:hypothetical protein
MPGTGGNGRWRRRELLCGSVAKTGKLLILRCAEQRQNALIAGPSYVELTWELARVPGWSRCPAYAREISFLSA